MRMSQKFDTCLRNPQRTSEDKSSNGIGSNDDRNQSEKRIVDKSPAVDSYFVEAEYKGNQSCQNCMETQERGEGNENSKRESKRRSLRWIIQREQTAKSGTKHFLSSKSRVSSFRFASPTGT